MHPLKVRRPIGENPTLVIIYYFVSKIQVHAKITQSVKLAIRVFCVKPVMKLWIMARCQITSVENVDNK